MVKPCQEIGLVLVAVNPLEERVVPLPIPIDRIADTGIVPGGDLVESQPHRVLQEEFELYLAVAQDIRIRSDSGGVAVIDILDNLLVVLLAEIEDDELLDSQMLGHADRFVAVLSRWTILVF